MFKNTRPLNNVDKRKRLHSHVVKTYTRWLLADIVSTLSRGGASEVSVKKMVTNI